MSDEESPRAPTFLDGAFGLSPGGVIVRTAPLEAYCCVCGDELALYFDDGRENFCEACCPDHDYAYDHMAGMHVCKTCGAARPADWSDW